jgi:hypothetical protein
MLIIVLINQAQLMGSSHTSPSDELSLTYIIVHDIHKFVIIKKGEIVEPNWVEEQCF